MAWTDTDLESFALGLAVSNRWNYMAYGGLVRVIDTKDNISPISVKHQKIDVATLTDTLNTATADNPTVIDITQNISSINVFRHTNLYVANIEEEYDYDFTIVQQTVELNVNNHVKLVDGDTVLNTDYKYVSTNRTVDDGKLIGVDIETSDKQQIDTFEVSENE